MKKVDDGEFFNSKLENEFQEFKPFSAEQYYTFEKAESSDEVISLNESFSNTKTNTKKRLSNDKSDFKELKKQMDRLENSSSTTSSSTSSSSSVSSSSSASQSTIAGSQSASTVATASISGGATVVAASIAIVAASSGIFTNIKPSIKPLCGRDYISISINSEDFISSLDTSLKLSAKDFSIELVDENKKIDLQEGDHTYLFTGLMPNKTYKYKVSCTNSNLGTSSNYYSDTITTIDYEDAKGIYDEINSFITFDEETKSAIYTISVYLSDYDKEYENVRLYLCNKEQNDLSNIKNVIGTISYINEENYLFDQINNINDDNLYLYLLGDKVDGSYNNKLLLTHQTTVDYPSDWEEITKPILEVVEGSEVDLSTPTKINVKANLNSYDENYELRSYINEYDSVGKNLVSKKEAPITIIDDYYEIISDAYYGLSKYQYVIYIIDENSEEVVLYESEMISYTSSQGYQGSYTKVEPKDSTITYFKDHVVIELDPSFSSSYDNYSYKLEVVNSSGVVYGSYQGQDKATITINNLVGLDEINFKYYDIGTFTDQEVVYASYNISGGSFGIPVLEIKEGTSVDTSSPTEIHLIADLTCYDSSYTLLSYVIQYNDAQEEITREEASVNIIEQPLDSIGLDQLEITCNAYYGISKYQYVIYILDENLEEVVLYESGMINYTSTQEYQGSYTKVETKDSTITYFKDHVVIEVDPSFSSSYDNYSYKLEVINSSGVVYGSYQGQDKATITINNLVGLDEINFKYYDIGTFTDQEVVYSSYNISGGTYGIPVLEIKEGTSVDTSSPTEIHLIADLASYDSSYTLLSYVIQYNEAQEEITREEASVNIIEQPLDSIGLDQLEITCNAYYGLSNYQYVIYIIDENSEEVVLYESEMINYTSTQEYQGSYTKVEPKDSTITYFKDHVVIELDPSFSSSYDNYSYKLEVVNSSGVVYGSYQGQDKATITINNLVGLDEINFKYYDIGTFTDQEVAHNSYEVTGVKFCVPSITLADDFGFDGDYFTLGYTVNMVYDYALASMDLIVNDGVKDYIKNVSSVSSVGIITLDNIDGALGNVTVELKLHFKDNQSDGLTHTLSSGKSIYLMNYVFSIEKVNADLTTYSTTMPIEIVYDYLLPNSFKLSIKDDTNGVDITTNLANSYYFDTIDKNNDINLSIQPLDGSSNLYGEAQVIHISKSEAEETYDSITCSKNATNPGDSLVTFNDDGTINIYRQVNFTTEDSRVTYNAFIFNSSKTIDGREVFTNSYDVMVSGAYAVIEDIPLMYYGFHYYTYFEYENVTYLMYMEYPSGGISIVDSLATCEVSTSIDSTTLNFTLSSYGGNLENKVVCNGVEYQFTSYTGGYDTSPSLTINSLDAITSIKIYWSEYCSNYDAFKDVIPVKGNLYKEYEVEFTIV